MISHFIQKFIVFSVLCIAVLANKESELEQPQALLGGVLKKPENCGFKASGSSDIRVHYRARAWGKEEYYEDTYLREKPLEVKLGKGRLIKGIEEGIDGMCTGEVRRLLIPSYKAYGELGIPNFVPPNTAVVVEVEMVEVISQFSNPWFWLSGAALCIVFYLYTQQQNMDARSSPGAFLAAQQKSLEKKDQ